MQQFLFAFPVWIVMKAGFPARGDFDGNSFLIVFTDQDLAGKFRAFHFQDAEAVPAKNPTDLIALLEWTQKHGADWIALDPTQGAGIIVLWRTSEVLAWLAPLAYLPCVGDGATICEVDERDCHEPARIRPTTGER
jgi:hypothetical protein